jgi:hypothetical protein
MNLIPGVPPEQMRRHPGRLEAGACRHFGDSMPIGFNGVVVGSWKG